VNYSVCKDNTFFAIQPALLNVFAQKKLNFLQMSTIAHDFFIPLQYERIDHNHLPQEQ
jgi:hypothetical protein